MGLTMIDVNNPRNRVEQYVVETVRKLANEAGPSDAGSRHL